MQIWKNRVANLQHLILATKWQPSLKNGTQPVPVQSFVVRMVSQTESEPAVVVLLTARELWKIFCSQENLSHTKSAVRMRNKAIIVDETTASVFVIF